MFFATLLPRQTAATTLGAMDGGPETNLLLVVFPLSRNPPQKRHSRSVRPSSTGNGPTCTCVLDMAIQDTRPGGHHFSTIPQHSSHASTPRGCRPSFGPDPRCLHGLHDGTLSSASISTSSTPRTGDVSTGPKGSTESLGHLGSFRIAVRR